VVRSPNKGSPSPGRPIEIEIRSLIATNRNGIVTARISLSGEKIKDLCDESTSNTPLTPTAQGFFDLVILIIITFLFRT
jgi:hypothetical protein